MNNKFVIAIVCILTIFSIWITFIHIDWLNQIQAIAQESGIWGYALFVIAYAIATLLILPVTAFNIAGGAIYGELTGLLLTSSGALLSAFIGFLLVRLFKFTINERWSNVSENLVEGGIAYSFAARLLPLIPYGVVSLAAGLSPIKRRDYLLGTLLGTPLGIAPFVFLGSTGVKVSSSSDLLPLLSSSLGLAVLVVAATWYKSSQKESN